MSTALAKLSDLDVRGKRVLLRVDYNVALDSGKVVEPKRIDATLPTLKFLIEKGASVILLSHLGRPKGVWDQKYSLKPVQTVLETYKKSGKLSALKCSFWDKSFTSPELKIYAQKMKPGEILLLENLRFDPGEEKNDLSFASTLASLGEVFVQEAFGAVHRAHASTNGLAKLLPSAAGLLVEKELSMLSKVLDKPVHPFVVILGGVKVSDKIGAIENLLNLGADKILIGGALAYTFNNLDRFEVSTPTLLLILSTVIKLRLFLVLFACRIPV